jgi:hypothetical protein
MEKVRCTKCFRLEVKEAADLDDPGWLCRKCGMELRILRAHEEGTEKSLAANAENADGPEM